MTMPETRDDSLGRVVHRTLLGGVILSAALLVCGLSVSLVQGAGADEAASGLGQIVRGAAAGQGVAMVNLGLIVLMLTPASRVAVLAVGWASRGRWRQAGIALAVALLLGISIVLGTG